MPKPRRINWIRWKDVCQSLRMAGHMQDFSQRECRRVAKLLRDGVTAGTVQHKREGSRSYWALSPDDSALSN
jgi:hypothetical protein